MKAWVLRLHRWVALVLALPLLVVIGTGLILSFEPWLVGRAIVPGTLTAEKVQALIARHDPKGTARALVHRSYDGTLTIGGGKGAQGAKSTAVAVATGDAVAGPSALASVLMTSRRLHETLLLDLGWLVIASTAGMLVLAALGVLLGIPRRLASTVSGWHKGTAWVLLPLIVLSPLTGLFLAFGISFSGPPPAPAPTPGAPLTLAEAVQIVGKQHDLSALIWLRPMGKRLMVRLVEDGEYKVYAVTRAGTVAGPRSWPRLWHEGNFAGAWSAWMNVILSVAMLGLLVTGLWLWLRRQVRRRGRRMQRVQGALQAGGA